MAENINENGNENIVNPDAPVQADASVEERLAQLMAENKRLKRASDKAASEAADYKKQLMASKTDSERVAMEKAEKDAQMMVKYHLAFYSAMRRLWILKVTMIFAEHILIR